jgi:hypothetical protein
MDQVQLGSTKLDTAVAPRFEVGYRIPNNWGSVSFGYGFLASQGSGQLTTPAEDVVQLPADQAGGLVYNIFDLTYNSREYSLDPLCNMRWGVGGRLLYFYFDSRVQFLNPGTDPGSFLAQSETSYERGYGFWAYLDLERQIGCSGLSIFGRVEGSDFYARIGQTYAETVAGNPGQALEVFRIRYTGAAGPSILREVVGISYTMPQWNHSRFLLGYQYEQFFQIGRLTSTAGVPDTRGSLDAHGFFFRAELNF